MTLYEIVKPQIPSITNDQLSEIGVLVSAKAKEIGVEHVRVSQIEGGKTFKVNSYPESFRYTIECIAIKYLQGSE